VQNAYANEADYRMCCIHNVTARLTVILQGCTDMEIWLILIKTFWRW